MSTRGYDRDAPPLETVPCALCSESSSDLLGREGPGFEIRRCARCDLIYVSPRVKDPEKSFWGEREGYEKAAEEVLAGRRPAFRDPNFREVLDLAALHQPQGRLLDVGAHLGFLLKRATERSWDAIGVEPSPTLSMIARERLGLDVRTVFLEEACFDDATFDVVLMVDVFEHVKNPRSVLREIARILRPGGILVLQIPNTHFTLWKAQIFHRLLNRPGKVVFDAEEHVCHYTEKTLRRMVECEGLEFVSIQPGRPVQWAGSAQIIDGIHMQHAMPWYAGFGLRATRSVLYWIARFFWIFDASRVAPTATNALAVVRRPQAGSPA